MIQEIQRDILCSPENGLLWSFSFPIVLLFLPIDFLFGASKKYRFIQGYFEGYFEDH